MMFDNDPLPPPSVSRVRRIRKRLGYWKWVLFQGGHKRVRLARKLARLDSKAAEQAQQLPRFVVPSEADDEVHILCGHAHVTIGLWSLWSFLKWFPGPVSVYLHSDGSITQADAVQWLRLFPGIHVVHPNDVLSSIQDRLPEHSFPKLWEFRRQHKMAPKLIDFHLAGNGKRVILMDTDVLFFRRPDELIGWWEEGRAHDRSDFVSFRDTEYAFVADLSLLNAKFGKVADRFNVGMCIIPKFDHSRFVIAERILSNFEPAWSRHYWAEQTIYGILAGEDARFLSTDYRIGSRHGDSVAAHYITRVRDKFYTEGVPALMNAVASQQ